VNIAGYDFELIDAARPLRAQLPAVDSGPDNMHNGFDNPDREPGGNRALARQSPRFDSLAAYDQPIDSDDESAPASSGLDFAAIHRVLRGR
jgi:hypothetical protein